MRQGARLLVCIVVSTTLIVAGCVQNAAPPAGPGTAPTAPPAAPVSPSTRPAQPGAQAKTITLFSQQQVQTIAFEMADVQGYYREEGLEVMRRYFASGTTAFQTFQTGQGDIVFSGDVPSINYWASSGHDYRVIAPVEKNQKGYALVTKADIKTIADLSGKTIALREGSTGSHFIDRLKEKYKLTKLSVKNMDGPAAVSALDKGDIDGFFYWAPFPARAIEVSGNRVHILATAGEVVSGYYTVLGARPKWLQENADTVERFLRASRRGQEYARTNRAEVITYVKEKYGLEEGPASTQYEQQQMALQFDEDFYRDFTSIAEWMQSQGMLKEPLIWSQFAYLDALRAIDSKLAPPVPGP